MKDDIRSDTFFSSLADSFLRPFSGGNLKRTILGILFTMLPFASFIARGDAYSMAAGNDDKLGQRAVLGLKMFLAGLIYAAPALFVYGVHILLCSLFLEIPLWISAALVCLTAVFAVRYVVLTPIACCALALGAPVRVAVSAREMKSIVSLSFGRYLLFSAVSLLMLLLFGTVTARFSLVALYFVSGPIAAVFNYVTAGFYMSCCRRALGLRVPPRASVPVRPAQAIAAFLAVVMVFAALPLRASASGSPESDPAADAERLKLLDRLKLADKDAAFGHSRKDILNDFYYNNYGKYEIRQKMATDLFFHVGDIALDFAPFIGNFKNGLQMLYYGYKAKNAQTAQEKTEALTNMGYKALGLALGGISHLVNGGRAVKGFGWLKAAVNASSPEKAKAAIDLTKGGVQIYDGINNAVKASDITTGRDDSTQISPYGFVMAFSYFVDNAFSGIFEKADPPRNMVYVYDQGGWYFDYDSGVSDGTTPLEPIRTPEPTLAPSDRSDSSVGTFIGRLEIPQTGVPGLSCQLSDDQVVITINENGLAEFSCYVNLSVSYSIAGTGTTTRSTIYLKQDLLRSRQDPSTGDFIFSFIKEENAKGEVSYSGQGYLGGGGTTSVTVPTRYTVCFSPKWTYEDGVGLKCSITGYVLVTPLTEGANETKLTFTCEKKTPFFTGY